MTDQKNFLQNPNYQGSAIRAQEQADCEMRLVAYKAELIEKIEGMKDVLMERGSMSFPKYDDATLDDVLAIIKEEK